MSSYNAPISDDPYFHSQKKIISNFLPVVLGINQYFNHHSNQFKNQLQLIYYLLNAIFLIYSLYCKIQIK